MKTIKYEVAQGSQEWLELRKGKITASRAKDLLSVIKTGESAAYRNYKAELLVERMTGKSPERYTSAPMEYGTQTEALARLMYSLKTKTKVVASTVYGLEDTNVLASLDGEIGSDGIVEIKCREIANHIDSLLNDKVPEDYYKQIQFQLWVTDRKWADYVSYCDEMPERTQLFIKRVNRDNQLIFMIRDKVEQLEVELSALQNKLERY